MSFCMIMCRWLVPLIFMVSCCSIDMLWSSSAGLLSPAAGSCDVDGADKEGAAMDDGKAPGITTPTIIQRPSDHLFYLHHMELVW